MLYGTLVDCQREFDHETADLGWLHFAISIASSITRGCSAAQHRQGGSWWREEPGEIHPAGRPVRTAGHRVQRTLIAIIMDLTEDLNAIEDFVYDPAPRDSSGGWRRSAPQWCRIHRHLRTVLA